MTTLKGISTSQVVNVASVAHRSPFRYPGGKTWLVPQIRTWLQSLDSLPQEFAEPFAGGAIVSLSVLFDELASKITLVELDQDVGAVWSTIVNGKGKDYAESIAIFKVSEESVKESICA